MRAISDKTLDEFETTAIEGAKRIRAFFAYEGTTNKTYMDKAKIGAVVIGGYARLRASETNRMSIEAAAAKKVK